MSTFWHNADRINGAEHVGFADIHLLGYRERVIHLDSKIAHGALDLSMPEQQLDSSEIAGATVDQRCLRSAQ